MGTAARTGGRTGDRMGGLTGRTDPEGHVRTGSPVGTASGRAFLVIAAAARERKCGEQGRPPLKLGVMSRHSALKVGR